MTAELTHQLPRSGLSMEECAEIRLFAALYARSGMDSADDSLFLDDILFQRICAESVVSYLQRSSRLRKYGGKELRIIKVPTDDASMYKIGLLSTNPATDNKGGDVVAFEFVEAAYDEVSQKDDCIEEAIMRSGIDTLIAEGTYRPDVADKPRMQHIQDELAHVGIPTTLSPIYQRGRPEPISYSLTRNRCGSSNIVRLDDHR